MTFIYGYEPGMQWFFRRERCKPFLNRNVPQEHLPGHVVTPPFLRDKITLTSYGETTRWAFFGTRREILDWMRKHSDMVIKSVLYNGTMANKPADTVIVFDLQPICDPEQSYYRYFRSFFVSDYENERVKCEIRQRIESRDRIIWANSRVLSRSDVRLGNVVDALEHEWYKPEPSLYQRAVDCVYDTPVPCHVISAASGPSSISIKEDTENYKYSL